MQALPIDAILPGILDTLATHLNLVIEAPPGAGKTTRVPRALLELRLGEVIVLEPRRLAARMAARRVAQELGQTTGRTVGYRVRFEECGGPETRLWYWTEGVLTRRMLSDATLRGVGIVVLDEFHERHIDTDLAIALVRRLQRTVRPDLRIVVMSATLDAAPIVEFLGGTKVLRSEGRLHPLRIEYTPHSSSPVEERIASAFERIAREGLDGDILAFLPGAAEIRRSQRLSEREAARAGMTVVPLYGDLPPAEQDRAVAPGPRPKLILSTNVAESSITIEGVTAVIDSGLARMAVDSPWTGLPSLNVARISKASARQRAGRAGRVRPGRVIRLYSEDDFARRPEHDVPEIARRELSQVLLDLHTMAVADLEWFDTPPETALNAARELLLRLGAMDANGLTTTGREMARLPLHPRLARIVVEGQRRRAGDAACAVAAVLSAGERIEDRPQQPAPSDLLPMIEGEWQATTRRVYDQVRRSLKGGAARGPDETGLLISILCGFPDRVARRRQASEYLLAGGGSAVLAETSAVEGEEFLVAVDVEARRDRGLPLIRVASAIRPEWLLDLFPDRVRDRSGVEWNRTAERVEAVSALDYDGLTIDETRGGSAEPQAAADLLAAKALDAGLARFFDREELDAWLARVAFAAERSVLREIGEDDLTQALRELCQGKRSFAELARQDLIGTVRSRTPELARLDDIAPARIRLPGGRTVRVNYERGKAPWIQSRLQDFFGMRETPSVAGTPVVVHLLAPNQRPVQMTSDLAGFWERLYPQIRRELSRRYPRHAWPEHPV